MRHVVWGLVPWGFHSRAAFRCHLVVGEVCVAHPPHSSSAEFLIQLPFAWLFPTVLGLISGPARIFSVFCGCICTSIPIVPVKFIVIISITFLFLSFEQTFISEMMWKERSGMQFTLNMSAVVKFVYPYIEASCVL